MKNMILMERLEARESKAAIRILCWYVCLPYFAGTWIGLVNGVFD